MLSSVSFTSCCFKSNTQAKKNALEPSKLEEWNLQVDGFFSVLDFLFDKEITYIKCVTRICFLTDSTQEIHQKCSVFLHKGAKIQFLFAEKKHGSMIDSSPPKHRRLSGCPKKVTLSNFAKHCAYEMVGILF